MVDPDGNRYAREYPSGFLHMFGRGLVRGVPMLMQFLSVVGTAAMLWVGGSIMVHGLHDPPHAHGLSWVHEHAEGIIREDEPP